MTARNQFRGSREVQIAAIIPAFNEAARIEAVIRGIPLYVTLLIVVNDASTDSTAHIVKALSAGDPRIMLIDHAKNQGVGGAVVSGFRAALEARAQIIVKIDGDGQMPVEFLPNLLGPLIAGDADYSKGNRFRDFGALKKMPLPRRVGNLALSFGAKSVTGYWDCFDPTNGFFAIRSEALRELPLEKLDRTYFFEHSMLIYLYLAGAVIRDVPMPARYLGEASHLRISRVLTSFPQKLVRAFVRRIILKNFLYDFNMGSMYILSGLPLLLFGLIFGAYKWIHYTLLGVGAPTGTVVIPTLCVILGVQLLLSAIEIDLRSTPKNPIGGTPLAITLPTVENQDVSR